MRTRDERNGSRGNESEKGTGHGTSRNDDRETVLEAACVDGDGGCDSTDEGESTVQCCADLA